MDFLYSWLLPQALSYGMTAEQFWYDDPQLFHSYGKAYDMIQERKIEYDNTMAWIQGQYHLMAIQHVLASSKSGKIYPKKPLEFTKKDDELSPEDMRSMRKARAKAMVERFNQK